MTDIVERLRAYIADPQNQKHGNLRLHLDLTKAASLIERQAAKIVEHQSAEERACSRVVQLEALLREAREIAQAYVRDADLWQGHAKEWRLAVSFIAKLEDHHVGD